MKKTYFPFFILFFGVFQLIGQTKLELDAKVDVSQAQYIGKTPPLRFLTKLDRTDNKKRKKGKELKGKTVPNFFNGSKFVKTRENTLPKSVDPALQSYINKQRTPNLEPILNMDGIDESVANVQPPDPNGDIGKNHYIQTVNASYFQIFDKDGNDVGGGPINANTLWASIGYQSAGDPVVFYDQQAERWIFTEFPFGNFLLFAISETSDPLGAWDAYSFSTPNFPDYPKYGIWNDAYIVTTNEGGTTEQPVYLINREDILNLEVNPQIQRVSFPGVNGAPDLQAAAPVDWTGNVPPPADALPTVIRFNDDEFGASEDRLELIEIDVDWENANNTQVNQINMPILPFESFPCAASGGFFACIPQLGGTGISGIEYFVTNQVHYRNFGTHESMVCAFLVDVTAGSNVAGIRWVEFRRTNSDWVIYQEGTYGADDGIHRFMGSICMDAYGNIAMGYTISGETIHPGVAYTGRKRSDPLGEMTLPEYVLAEGLSTNPTDRQGDYAATMVDPENGRTFWFTAEYMKENGLWGTKIAAFEIQSDTTDIAPIDLITPQNSNTLTDTEPITIEIINYGLDTPSTFQVGYILDDGVPVIEDVIYTLFPDSIYTHTFTSTANMEDVGVYNLKLFTSLEGDSAVLNDTLYKEVIHLFDNDAGIVSVNKEQEGVSCGGASQIHVNIQNYGGDTLLSVDLSIKLNGNLVQSFTIPFSEGLAYGESDQFDIYVSNLEEGSNDVVIYTSNPNGEEDLSIENDTSTIEITTSLNGTMVSLELLTDDYGSETSWDLINSDGDTLYTGGIYASNFLTTESWCLTAEQCYTFKIYDSYGDGICCDWGNGNYDIKNQNGEVITSMLTTNWLSSETNLFCLDSNACTLSAQVDASITSSIDLNDGAIMITAQNGTPPYVYSIDNGENFSSTPMFSNLEAGLYNVIVKDAQNCSFIETIEVPFCSIVAGLEIQHASSQQAQDGSITVQITSVISGAQYSIDNGATFTSNNVFTSLLAGTYEILIQDSLGCTTSIAGTVDFNTGVNHSILYASNVVITPNPTKDVVNVFVPGNGKTNTYLNLEVLNEIGQKIYSSNLTKYNDGYTGQLSFYHLPKGIYYIRFLDREIGQMMKVIKD